VCQGGVQAALDEALPHPLDCAQAAVQGLGDVGILPGRCIVRMVNLDLDADTGRPSLNRPT
jgi:hypothetical protein